MISVSELLSILISFRSISPSDGGALDFLAKLLKDHGFNVFLHQSHGVNNLYAVIGESQPNVCFAGHVDVVPPGDLSLWNTDPFTAVQTDNKLYGRGTVDMKGALAAMLAAGLNFVAENGRKFKGSLSFLITSDEEGEALYGTKEIIKWLYQKGHRLDFVILGEPTCVKEVGDTIKIGRRGSANFDLAIYGEQGHVAYPELADNPHPTLIKILQYLLFNYHIDKGNKYFLPSNLEITSITCDNEARNVIPAAVHAKMNVRFNDLQNHQSLVNSIREVVEKFTKNYSLKSTCNAEPFISTEVVFTKIFKEVVKETTGIDPLFSTSGGTSDARFIKDYAPVLEFGLLSDKAHAANEYCLISDLQILYNVYYNALRRMIK